MIPKKVLAGFLRVLLLVCAGLLIALFLFSSSLYASDTTAPTITVSAGSVANSFKAVDDDSDTTTMVYVWVSPTAVCGSSTNFSSATTYTEGEDIIYNPDNQHLNRLCLRSTDAASNSGYKVSGVVIDYPTITITRTTRFGQPTLRASSSSGGSGWRTSFRLSFLPAGDSTCDGTVDFSNASSIGSSHGPVIDTSHHDRYACVQAQLPYNSRQGEAGNVSGVTVYSYARYGPIDSQAPTVTVSAGSVANSFKAVDDDSGTTTMVYVWTAAAALCDYRTSFSSATSYTEGEDITYNPNTRHLDRLCLRSTDAAGNHGYKVSDAVVDHPTITVTRTTISDGRPTLRASSSGGGSGWTPSFRLSFLPAGDSTCDGTVNFSGVSSISSNSGPLILTSHHGRYACLRTQLRYPLRQGEAGSVSVTTVYSYARYGPIDAQAPTITISAGSVANSFKAVDDDSDTTTWVYVWTGTTAYCDFRANFSSATAYTEGEDITYTPSTQDRQRLCLRSTDAAGNHGYKVSEPVFDYPTLTITRTTRSGQPVLRASSTSDGSGWRTYYNLSFLPAGNSTCDGTVDFSSASIITNSSGPVIDASHHGRYACVRAELRYPLRQGETGSVSTVSAYAYGRYGPIDAQAPTITVSAGSVANSLKAVDDDSGTTTWAYVWTRSVCDFRVNFSSATSYTEGEDISYTASDNGRKICFRSTDSNSNSGYQASEAISFTAPDTTAPTITVSAGSVANSFKAVDDDSGTTAWVYILVAGTAACDSSTDFASATSYTEGEGVGYTATDNGKKICFRSTDSSNNAGYQASDLISFDTSPQTDTTPPTITISTGSATNSFKAVDDDPGTTTWVYVKIAGSSTCGSSTDFASATSYTEGGDISYTAADNGQKICFRSTDSNSNAGYQASEVINITVLGTKSLSNRFVLTEIDADPNGDDNHKWQYRVVANNAPGGFSNRWDSPWHWRHYSQSDADELDITCDNIQDLFPINPNSPDTEVSADGGTVTVNTYQYVDTVWICFAFECDEGTYTFAIMKNLRTEISINSGTCQ